MLSMIREFYKKQRLKYLLRKRLMPVKYDKTTVFLSTFDIFCDYKADPKISTVIIGKNTKVGCQCFLQTESAQIKIGERCAIGSGTKIISAESIEIGNDVIIAWDCYIYDHNSHSVYWNYRKDDVFRSINNLPKIWKNVKKEKIIIHDKVWIGFGAVILKGVEIGEGAVIGARSVVTRDVPSYTVVAGNPALPVYKIIN